MLRHARRRAAPYLHGVPTAPSPPSPSPSPRVAVLPADVRPWAAAAARSGGATITSLGDAEALVWTATGFEEGFRPSDLAEVLLEHPAIRWVQLPWAGGEPYA